ncbi:MAG TPA: RsmG family class I SAM-dependent methyltransferase, partial [Dehalococcoidia bacterium]|nr:RsmG family class I SAM-dependent methyltransferase [Dehalococcoidia bacterium]
FVQSVIDRLGLAGAEVLTGRAEDLAHRSDLRETHDLAVARALAPLPVLLELTLPFVRISGSLILHKTWPWAAELAAAEAARDRLGGAWQDLPKEPPDEGSRRTLIAVAKVAPTPETYPRRSGIPAKRPIGSA